MYRVVMPLLKETGFVKKIIDQVEKVLYLLVGTLLVIMALAVFVQSAADLSKLTFSSFVNSQIAKLLNDALFTIIILELLSTVVSHLFRGGFQLKAFLVIGIISSVRRVLVIGAQLSTTSTITNSSFNRGIIELGVDAGVVLLLSVALAINRKYSTDKEKKSDTVH